MKKEKTVNQFSGLLMALFVAGFVLASVQSAFPQANDFFTNSQETDARAGFGGGVNVSPSNPGFNPCTGTAALSASANVDGVCSAGTGAVDANSLLTSGTATSNLDVIFIEAGPGAITDNMFGKVTVSGSNHTVCQATPTDLTIVTLADGLNCGNVRITPNTQGMNIPVFDASAALKNSLNSVQSGNADQKFDVCARTMTDCDTDPGVPVAQEDGAHMALNLVNRFEWNPSTTVPGTCVVAGGAGADAAGFCSRQIMEQITSLFDTGNGNIGIGDNTPGTSDQWVRIETQFDTTSTTNLDFTGLPTFTVRVFQHIQDPDMSGTGGAGFSQTLGTIPALGGAGTDTFSTEGLTFTHDAPNGGSAQVFICPPTAAGSVGCSIYPTGRSLTEGDVAATLP